MPRGCCGESARASETLTCPSRACRAVAGPRPPSGRSCTATRPGELLAALPGEGLRLWLSHLCVFMEEEQGVWSVQTRTTLALACRHLPPVPCRVPGTRCEVACARPCAALHAAPSRTRRGCWRHPAPQQPLLRHTPLHGAVLLHCGIVYYSAPHCIIPGCSPRWSRLLGSVTRLCGAGLGLVVACLHLPLPGFSAGGFGARFPALWAGAGGRGWSAGRTACFCW